MLVSLGSWSTALSLQREPLGFNWPGKELAQPCHQTVVSVVMVHQFPNIHHARAFYPAHVPTLPALVWEACKDRVEILAEHQVSILSKKHQTILAHLAHGLTLKKSGGCTQLKLVLVSAQQMPCSSWPVIAHLYRCEEAMTMWDVLTGKKIPNFKCPY